MRLALCAIAAALALPGVAAAEQRTGSAADPAGDAAPPVHDITNVQATYDTAGIVQTSVTLAGAPDPATPAAVIVIFGKLDGGACVTPDAKSGIAVAYEVPGGTAWMAGAGSGKLADPVATLAGNVASATGKDIKLLDQPWNCVRAMAGGPDAKDPADTIDGVALAAKARKTPAKTKAQKRRAALRRCAKKKSKTERRRCIRRVRSRG